MRIDQKYFPHFLAIMAALGAIVITIFTINNRQADRDDFKERMFAQDSLQTEMFTRVQGTDSVKVSDFPGQIVVLDFWANWSDVSLESHEQLARVKQEYPDKLQVISAAVGLQKKDVFSYIDKHDFPFEFVAGSRQFSSYGVPGLPAQLVYNTQGNLESVFMGYTDESQYDSLRVLLNYYGEE